MSNTIGSYINGKPFDGPNALKKALLMLNRPVFVIKGENGPVVAENGYAVLSDGSSAGVDEYEPVKEGMPLLGFAPRLMPEDLGDPEFRKAHGLKYAYVAGAMANAITSVKMVEEAGKAGMIGFFGAAGLPPSRISKAMDELKDRLGDLPFGSNLIHNHHDPAAEMATAELYVNKKIRYASASAYMNLTPPLVYYRVKGIHKNIDGAVICPNKVFAKVSRVEVARRFFSPPPEKILEKLVELKLITKEEAILSASVPMAEDLTAEADSGGHTDNRPAISLLPTMLALRDEMQIRHGYQTQLRVGLGGGIATPDSTASAFAMGAAYVLTGSVNQACVEAGTSEIVRKMLAEAHQADVIMAPSADMFELGVKVQVLKRGTMFPMKAARLYDIYNRYDSMENLPDDVRNQLERDFFKKTTDEEWQNTRKFFEIRDPRQIDRAEKSPKHKMALVFRSYLGQSSNWAVTGDPERRIDYQIWCGPAMGAFNEWVRGSFLENYKNRETVTVAMNLLFGAAFKTRVHFLKCQGVDLPVDVQALAPMPLYEITSLTGC